MPDLPEEVAAKWLRRKLADRNDDFDLFQRPEGGGGDSGDGAGSEPPALFDRPPSLFQRPPGAPGAAPQPSEPSPAPEPPAARPRRPRAPAAPPAEPAGPPRDAPPGRGRQVDFGPETQALRRTRDFKQFVREKYEGGRAQIQHPDPDRRQRRRTIKFWTAMKYDTFKAKVKREFEAWLQEEEARRPRAAIGARVMSPAEVRKGDFVQGQSYPFRGWKFKVVHVTPGRITLQRVDANGRPKGTKLRHFNQNRLRGYRGKLNRIEEVKRPEVELDQAKEFLDRTKGHPPRTVNNREAYREWMEKAFLEHQNSPYFRLGDDEPDHKAKLKEHIDKILDARNIGEDWEWTAPPHVDIGQRANSAFQLRAGDFVKFYSQKYKVVEIQDNGNALVQRVDSNGRPFGRQTSFNDASFRQNTVVRIEEVKRPDVDFDAAKKFANDSLGFPDRNINSQDDYREWLMKKFLETERSPYYALGEDEESHQKSLEKQVEKILEDRGVGEGWEWQPPPHADIGQRIRDPFQLHVGDFVGRGGYRYKVLDITDDGKVKVILFSTNQNIPQDAPVEWDKSQWKYSTYTREEAIKRPDVSYEDAKQFVDDKVGFPPPAVDSKSAYREWLEKKLTETAKSPFYYLGEDEESHQKALKKHIDKILDARNIGSDWQWTPPPQADIGQRVHQALQLRVGDFIQYPGHRDGYRVAAVRDDGKLDIIAIDSNGRPTGHPAHVDDNFFKRHHYNRIEPIKRPEVTDDKAKAFADKYLDDPGRGARTQEKYREWLHREFRNNPKSPYAGLGDDEPEHQARLQAQVEQILQARDIGEDWEWRPPPLIAFPAEADWERQHDAVRRVILEGDHIQHPEGGTAPRHARGAHHDRKDKHLGGGINGADLRRMQAADGTHQDYVFKDKRNEAGAGRMGAPPGTLHLREQAAYGLDRLLGDGIITPPTASDGSGSYQHFREDAAKWGGRGPSGISARDMSRHADVQRMLVMDEIMGHEDRHYGNLMYAWADPDGPKTADNMRVISIDNGYAFANPDAKRSAEDFTTVACGERCLPFEGSVYKGVLEHVPEELHEKIKKVKIPDLLQSLKKSGITDRGALMASAARIMALQDSPDVIGKFLSRARSHDKGRKQWRYTSAKEPQKLFRDYTDLPASAYDDLVRMVDEAVA